MELHTTFRLLRNHGACKPRYTLFRRGCREKGIKGDDTPIPLTVVLALNGLDDTLWALQAVLPQEASERDRISVLFAADCGEHVLHIFERMYPDDPRPRQAIEEARRLSIGQAAPSELAAAWDVASNAAGAARDAARAAAWAAGWAAARDAGAAAWPAVDAAGVAARDAEVAWQQARLHSYLADEAR